MHRTNDVTNLSQPYEQHDLGNRRRSESLSINTVRETLLGEEASTRSLLRKSSHATTSDFEVLQEVGGENVEAPRQRNGFRSNWNQLLHKKSVLSQRTQSTFDGNFAHGKPGWWRKQMLSDRSLRSMAVFTALCAIIIFIIVFSYLKDFITRLNKNSTSVGGKDGESCETAETRNLVSWKFTDWKMCGAKFVQATHLFINVAATMILGCSNTYQQLVTALKVNEIRWVLSKRGDSKVGTNSPWAINHKRDGKTTSWLAWLLLISTSIVCIPLLSKISVEKLTPHSQSTSLRTPSSGLHSTSTCPTTSPTRLSRKRIPLQTLSSRMGTATITAANNRLMTLLAGPRFEPVRTPCRRTWRCLMSDIMFISWGILRRISW